MTEDEREDARRGVVSRAWMELFVRLVPASQVAETGRYWEAGGRPAETVTQTCATGYVYTGEHGDG